jgi:hypothetical protein
MTEARRGPKRKYGGDERARNNAAQRAYRRRVRDLLAFLQALFATNDPRPYHVVVFGDSAAFHRDNPAWVQLQSPAPRGG